MALEFPWKAFLEIQREKNAQKDTSWQDIVGQALGTAGKLGGEALQQRSLRKQKQQKQKQTFDDLSQIPQLASLAGPISRNPELLSQLGPVLLKPQKPTPEYSVVGGEMSPAGEPLIIDKFSGEIRPSGPKGSKATGTGASLAPIRTAQYTMQDLPSNQAPTTSGGAAYQVKVAARQGKTIIAKAGSAQRTGMATGDLARAILRAAPTDDAMKSGNFSDNMVTRWSLLKQKLTADPGVVDNPKVRREIYNIFDEMDKSAEPFIRNQLDEMSDQGFPVSKKTYERQLGLNIPDVPFIDLTGQTNNPVAKPSATGYADPGKEARFQAWKKANGQ